MIDPDVITAPDLSVGLIRGPFEERGQHDAVGDSRNLDGLSGAVIQGVLIAVMNKNVLGRMAFVSVVAQELITAGFIALAVISADGLKRIPPQREENSEAEPMGRISAF